VGLGRGVFVGIGVDVGTGVGVAIRFETAEHASDAINKTTIAIGNDLRFLISSPFLKISGIILPSYEMYTRFFEEAGKDANPGFIWPRALMLVKGKFGRRQSRGPA
jgi:hypothetical protein